MDGARYFASGALVLVACTSSSESTIDRAPDGAVPDATAATGGRPAAGSGGTPAGGGTSGMPGSTGGTTPATGGAGGSTEDAAVTTPRPCAPSTRSSDPGAPAALRPDIGVRRVADAGGDSVRIARDPLSGALFVLHTTANVYSLDPESGQSPELVIGSSEIGGAPTAQGMAFGPDGTLYVVGNEPQANRTRAIVRRGVVDGSGGRTWSTLATTSWYPESNTPFDHHFNGLAVSPDGRSLFVASGSRTDHGEIQTANGAYPGMREVPLTSALFRLPTDGEELFLDNDTNTLAASGLLFADGLRNAFDPAFAPNGDLIAGDNGPDADYSEELNWLREGRHYGFPWRLGDADNAQQFPDYDPGSDRRLQSGFSAVDNGTYVNDPTFPRAAGAFVDPIANRGPDADRYRDPADGSIRDASENGESLATFTAHRSPLGLSFDTEGALCGELYQAGFVLSYGAAAGNIPDRGSDLLLLELEKAGDRYTVGATELVTGFDRPVDSVLVGSRLYVLQHGGAGTIWEVSLPEP